MRQQTPSPKIKLQEGKWVTQCRKKLYYKPCINTSTIYINAMLRNLDSP